MLKIALRLYLLASVLTLISVCVLHDQFTLSVARFVSAVYFCSFFSIPGIIVFNVMLIAIRSLKQPPFISWIILLGTILLVTHFALLLLVSFDGVNPGTVELIWLVVNSSAVLALFIQFPVIHHLFKSFGHEKQQSYTIG